MWYFLKYPQHLDNDAVKAYMDISLAGIDPKNLEIFASALQEAKHTPVPGMPVTSRKI